MKFMILLSLIFCVTTGQLAQLSDPQFSMQFSTYIPQISILATDSALNSIEPASDYTMMSWVYLQELSDIRPWKIETDGQSTPEVHFIGNDEVQGMAYDRNQNQIHTVSLQVDPNLQQYWWYQITITAWSSHGYLGIMLQLYQSSQISKQYSIEAEFSSFNEASTIKIGHENNPQFIGQVYDIRFYSGNWLSNQEVNDIAITGVNWAEVWSSGWWGPGNHAWNDFVAFVSPDFDVVFDGGQQENTGYIMYDGTDSLFQYAQFASENTSVTGWFLENSEPQPGSSHEYFRAQSDDCQSSTGPTGLRWSVPLLSRTATQYEYTHGTELQANFQVLETTSSPVGQWRFVSGSVDSTAKSIQLWYASIDNSVITWNSDITSVDFLQFAGDSTSKIGISGWYTGFPGKMRDVRYYHSTSWSSANLQSIVNNYNCVPFWKVCAAPDECRECQPLYVLNGGQWLSCGANCLQWSSSSNCVQCDSGFYLLSTGACSTTCPDGWLVNAANATWDLVWYTDCATCVDPSETGCLTCYSPSAQIYTSPGKWECKTNTYQDSKVPLVCVECHESWASCRNSGLGSCTSCYGFAEINNGQCMCPVGYFADPGVASCSACSQGCATCTSTEETACSSCIDNGYVDNLGRCLFCLIGQYYNEISEQWEACSSSWISWTTKEQCIEWQDPDMVANDEGLCVKRPWYSTEFQEGDNWYPCQGTCQTCVTNEIWLTWKEYSTLAEERFCLCIAGYYLDTDGWVPDTTGPIPSLNVNIANILVLSFSEEISQELKNLDLSLSVEGPRDDGYDYEWKLTPNSITEYVIDLSFDHDDIPGDTSVVVTLDSNIQDLYGNFIEETTLTQQLYEKKATSESSEYSDIIEMIMLCTSRYVTTAAFISSTISGSYSSLWNMVYSLQIIAYIPLMKIDLPEELHLLWKAFREIGPIPNLILYVRSEDDFDDEPFNAETEELGYKTTIFLINSGRMISQILVLLFLFTFALLISRCKSSRIQLYSQKVVYQFRWNFFHRAWSISYIEIAVAWGISVAFPIWNDAILGINTVLGYIAFAGIWGTPLFVWFFFVKFRYNIQNPSQKFAKDFGALFNEFKNDTGIISTFFYPIFFTRRVFYIGNLVILRYWTRFQFTINIVHTWVFLLFLYAYRPFKATLTNIVSVTVEFIHLVIFFLVFAFYFEWAQEKIESLKWTVLALIFVNIVLMLTDVVISQVVTYRGGHESIGFTSDKTAIVGTSLKKSTNLRNPKRKRKIKKIKRPQSKTDDNKLNLRRENTQSTVEVDGNTAVSGEIPQQTTFRRTLLETDHDEDAGESVMSEHDDLNFTSSRVLNMIRSRRKNSQRLASFARNT